MKTIILAATATGLVICSFVASAAPDGLEALVGKEIPRFECRTYGSWGTLAKGGRGETPPSARSGQQALFKLSGPSVPDETMA